VFLPPPRYDSLTNVLTDVYGEAYARLNPDAREGDAEKKLAEIRKSLLNDDLGREFYSKILLNSGEGKIVDFSSPENFRTKNTFQVATEMTCGDRDGDNYRPDITLFVNGLPLAFIEVKKQNNHTGINAETSRMDSRFKVRAFRRYLNITQIMVFSNDMEYDNDNVVPTQGAFYATIGKNTTKYNCFREDGQTSFPVSQRLRPLTPQMEESILRDNNVVAYRSSPAYQTSCNNHDTPTKRICNSLFSFSRLYFLLKYAIAYVDDPNGLQKHIMRYPQLFATKAIENYLDEGHNKGIIWHTQGSGKTALAYYCVKYLTDYYARQGIIPQFYFIVDRLDLLNQAQKEFSMRGLRVTSIQSKDDFRKVIGSNLTTQNHEGQQEITVVNIQKFSEDSRATSRNDYNLKIRRIYFIDEAHRDYKPDGCFLKNLLASDTQSVKIALTGTPIVSQEFNTKDIFGDYIHTYYYNASISDGYTLRLIREDIGSNFKVEMQEALNSIRVKDNTVTDTYVKSHPSYVTPMLDYVIDDFHQFRVKNGDNTLGSMVVCNSKPQAENLYRLFLQKYADPAELANERAEDGSIIYKSVSPDVIDAKTASPAKGCYRAALILCDYEHSSQKQWIDLFKEGKIDLLIVFQMLQTGFDAPRLKRLYLNRVVKEHNLLQTLTRVNRPYKKMRYGYVVDFANIEEEYKRTSSAYRKEIEDEVGKDNYQEYDQLFVDADEAKQRMDANHEVLKDFNLSDPQVFTYQIDNISDRDKVRSIVKALEDIRDLENLLFAQGQKPDDVINIPELQNLLKTTRQRLDLMSFDDNSNDIEEKQQLLNMALENINFSFYKRSEEELVLEEQFKESVTKAREQLSQNIDTEDPRYRSLLEDFLRLFKKNDMDSEHQFNLHQRFDSLKEILRKVKVLNQEDAIIALKYHNDRKYARIQKRLQEKERETSSQPDANDPFAWTKDMEKLNFVLNAIKDDADGNFFSNQALLQNPSYFARLIMTIVANKMSDAKIDTDRPVRKYISNVINREYQSEYSSQ
jgi:type I restriction enzyme R subunit